MKTAGTAKIVGVAAVGVACVAATAIVAFAGTEESQTVRVNVSTTGEQQAENVALVSGTSAVSNGGRFVVFSAATTTLAPNGNTTFADVYIRDTQAGTTAVASVGVEGAPGNGTSKEPSISADGRYVAFESDATNLVSDDTNAGSDVFVRDLVAGTTVRASVSGSGAQAVVSTNDKPRTTSASISPDGRFVAFVSSADNLVPNDTNADSDVFVRDLTANTTVRVNVSTGEKQADKNTFCDLRCKPKVSNLGTRVVFTSFATNLAPNDTNGDEDVFVRDMAAGTTTRVNVSNESTQAPGDTQGAGFEPSITSNGRYVYFTSFAPNLVPGDTNGTADLFRRDLSTFTTTLIKPLGGSQGNVGQISGNGRYFGFESSQGDLKDVPSDTNTFPDAFVRDVVTGVSTPVSVASDGTQGNEASSGTWLSPDGRAAVFTSKATNLVDGDTNGVEDVFLHKLEGAEPGGSLSAPTGRFTLSNAAALWPGQPVTVTQTALSGNGNPAAGIGREVLWGDGSAPQLLAAGATTATHAYPKAGQYKVQVVLIDQAGNRTGVPLDGSSNVVVTAAPSTRTTLDKTSIFATQSVSLGLVGVPGAAKVAWGDGTTSSVAAATARVTHAFAKAGSFAVTVTPSNAAGAGTAVAAGSVTVVKDTFAPVASVKAPKNPAVAASWKQLAGTVTDRGLGVRTVQVIAIQKRGAVWFAYTGKTWVRATSQAVAQSKAARLAVVPSAKGGWARALTGVKKGTLKVTYSGADKAGNTAAAKVLTQAITK